MKFLSFKIANKEKFIPLNKKAGGFTLVELVVYLGLFSLIIFFIFEFFLNILTNQTHSRVQEAVLNNAIVAINTIETEIKHARHIYNETSDFSSGVGYISLATNKDLPPNEEISYVDIYLNSDKQLCVKNELRGVRCITTKDVEVASLNFNKTLFDDGSDEGIQTILTIEHKGRVAEEDLSYTLQSFARLRSF